MSAGVIWGCTSGSGFRLWSGVALRVKDPEFRVQGSGFRVQGSGLKVQGTRFRVQGSGFRVQGSGFRVFKRLRVWGLRFWVWV